MWKILNGTLLILSVLLFATLAPAEVTFRRSPTAAAAADVAWSLSAVAAADAWEQWTVDSLERLSPYRQPLDLMSDKNHETREQHDARYKELARDLVTVVRKEKPLPGLSRMNTLRLALSVAFFESGFHQAVDLGYRRGRGDGGRSWCLLQLQLGNGTVPVEDEEMRAWKGPDLVADRTKCFRAGLEIMRRSMSACASLPARSRLSAYASGKCSKEETEGVKRWLFAWGKILGRRL